MSARATVVIIILLLLLLGGVVALRANTMSREQAEPDADTQLVVEFQVEAKRLPAHELLVVATAIFNACRLQAEAGLEQPVSQVSQNRFRAVLTPAPNQTDRKQLSGCLSDLTLAHTYSGEVEMRESDQG